MKKQRNWSKCEDVMKCWMATIRRTLIAWRITSVWIFFFFFSILLFWIIKMHFLISDRMSQKYKKGKLFLKKRKRNKEIVEKKDHKNERSKFISKTLFFFFFFAQISCIRRLNEAKRRLSKWDFWWFSFNIMKLNMNVKHIKVPTITSKYTK